MKKFTLILAAALVSLGSTAQTVQQRAEIMKALSHPNVISAKQHNIQQSLLFSPDEVKKAKLETAKILKSAPKRHLDVKKAEGTPRESKYDIFRTYYVEYPYLDNWQSSAQTSMNEGTVAVSNDSVRMLVDGNFAYFQGKRSADNYFTQKYGPEVGIDSITFSIEGNTFESNDGTKTYNLALMSYDKNSGFSRLSDKTFGAYYFKDSKQIVCRDLLYGFFVGDSSTPVEYTVKNYQYHYCADSLDAATFRAKVVQDYVNSEGKHINLGSDTARVVFAGDCMFIKGLSVANPDAWYQIDYQLSEDQTDIIGAYVYCNQYIGSGTLELTDGSKPYCDIVFYPVTVSGEKLYLAEMLNMFLDYNEDGTIVLSSDGSAYYAELFGSKERENLGLYCYIYGDGSAFDAEAGTVITITNEIISGIKGVNAQAAAGNATVEYFDLQGRRVDASAKGLVVKRVRSANGVVTSTKILK